MEVRCRRRGLSTREQLLNSETDVLGDLPEQRRRYVSALVEGDGSHPPIGMPELFV